MLVSLASEPGDANKLNEDWVGATNRVAVVLDGLSEGPSTGCIHGTPWYVSRLGLALLRHSAESASLTHALALAISEVSEMHADTCDLRHPGSPCSTVAMIRESADRLDYLVLSDSVIAFNQQQGVRVITDKTVETIATTEAQQASAVGGIATDSPYGFNALITEQQRHRNTQDGYWVAQIDPGASEHAITGTVDLSNVRGVLLLSDGAARPVVDFNYISWEEMFKHAESAGPQSLISLTRKLEKSDSEGSRWRRYKRHDDATAAFCIREPNSYSGG